MAGTARPSSPGGRPPIDKVRKLQRQLWVAAKRSPERRFHALLDRIFRGDVLEEAWRRVRSNRGAAGVDRVTLADLGLELHPEKTRIVDLREGREGFDFLGCHFRARMSGRLLERGIRRYYLHRWPSAQSMKRVRQKIRDRTGSNRNGVKDVRVLIRDLNPILRGWGTYFRTGNASLRFRKVDDYVERRLRRFLIRRYGRALRRAHFTQWTRDWFDRQGLYRLLGTIRYPEAA